jgi:hypothetical protein
MTIFVVFAREPKPQLQQAIETHFPGDQHYVFSDRVYLISASGTANEISEKLNVSGKEGGLRGVVVMATTTSYFGVAQTTLWDWLKARIEASKNG